MFPEKAVEKKRISLFAECVLLCYYRAYRFESTSDRHSERRRVALKKALLQAYRSEGVYLDKQALNAS